jgi:hypothetical protein
VAGGPSRGARSLNAFEQVKDFRGRDIGDRPVRERRGQGAKTNATLTRPSPRPELRFGAYDEPKTLPRIPATAKNAYPVRLRVVGAQGLEPWTR